MEKMTTQKQVRAAFWAWVRESSTDEAQWRYARRKRHKAEGYDVRTRCAFVDFVDMLARDGQISEKLAQRVTL